MKVLFITTSFPRSSTDPLPAGNFILDMAEQLQKKGVEITVLAPHVPGTPTEYSIGGIRVIRVKYLPKSIEQATIVPGGIPELIRKKDVRLLLILPMISSLSFKTTWLFRNFDIIHVHWLFNIFSLLPARIIQKKPCLVTIHGADAILVQKIPWLGKLFSKYCEAAITVNKDQIQVMKNWFNHIRYIPYGVKDNFSPLPEKEIITIGTVGHFASRKNFKTLALALKLIYEQGLNFRAYFVGDGDERGIIESIVKPFRSKVTITGYVPHDKVFELLKKFHVFVLPSFSEGKSNALLEAMATGRAIVASSIPQNTEFVRDGVNGLLFDPNSPQELAEKLILLIKNKQLLIKLAKNSYNTIRELGLTWEKTAEKYYKLYQELLKEAK